MVCDLIKSQTNVIEFQWVESELCSIHVPNIMHDRYFTFLPSHSHLPLYLAQTFIIHVADQSFSL